MAFPLGNFAALRTMRVLRALKTVAVVPGSLSSMFSASVEFFQMYSEQQQTYR